jgi:hypothetical protein
MKNRSDTEAIRAYTIIYDELAAKGLKPLFQTIENEATTALKTFLRARKMKLQLVPPRVHRQNAAERAIRTFKNHFLICICSEDKQFPLHLWDRLTPHAVITLNLLRQSRINPKLLAYAQLNGPFDFNHTPVAPPGDRVIFHEKPHQRRTWAAHGINGFYLGPEMEHYRCHRIYYSLTGQELIVDTVEFMPQHCKVPCISIAEAAVIAATDLTHALLHPSTATPFQQLGSKRMQATKELATIFDKMASPPGLTPRVPTVTTTTGQPTPQTQSPRVRNDTMTPEHNDRRHPSPRVPVLFPHVRRSPRQHQPAIISQEERAYTLIATTLPNTEQAFAFIDHLTGQQLEYHHLLKRPELRPIWENAFTNKLVRLAQGIRDIEGTDTIEFITAAQVPRARQITYGRLVCDIPPQKKETHRVRLTMGGDIIDYPGETATRNADSTTSKCLWNSTI